MKTLNLAHVIVNTAEEVSGLPLIARFVAKYGNTLVSVSRYDGVIVEVLVEGPELAPVLPEAKTTEPYVDDEGIIDLTSVEVRFPDLECICHPAIKEHHLKTGANVVRARFTEVNFLGGKEEILIQISYGRILPKFERIEDYAA